MYFLTQKLVHQSPNRGTTHHLGMHQNGASIEIVWRCQQLLRENVVRRCHPSVWH